MQIELTKDEYELLGILGFIRSEIDDLRKLDNPENELYLKRRIRDFEDEAVLFALALTKEIVY